MLSIAIKPTLFKRSIYSYFGHAHLYTDSPDLRIAKSSYFNFKKLLKEDVSTLDQVQ